MKKGVDKYNKLLYNKITTRDKPTDNKKERLKNDCYRDAAGDAAGAHMVAV